MKKITTIALFTLIATTAAWAGPGMGSEKGNYGDHGDMGERTERMARKLNLTSEQQQQLKALREEAHKQMKPLRDQLREARMTTADLIADDKAPEAEIMKSVVAEGAAYLALGKARAEHQIKVRELIGAEKAQQLVDMRREHGPVHKGPKTVGYDKYDRD